MHLASGVDMTTSSMLVDSCGAWCVDVTAEQTWLSLMRVLANVAVSSF